MTAKEIYNRLKQLIESGQITGNEDFGFLEYSPDEGDFFVSPDDLHISDDYTKIEMI